jgi:hypothetical protein
MSLCLLVGALTIPVRGQGQQKKPVGGGIFGYLDPQTGAFRPSPPAIANDEEALATVTPTTGKFVFNFTITVDSAIPSTATIACEASAETLEAVTQHIATETATVAATRSGTTAKCTVTIPYSWVLTTPKTDTVTLTYILSAPTSAPLLPARMSSQTVAVITVPLNGATTTESVSAVF